MREVSGAGPHERHEADGPDIDVLSDEVLPALIARLRASRLGELEVRADGWRVRLRRDVLLPPAPTRSAPHHGGSGDAGADAAEPGSARSPAVGYFSASPALEPGRRVAAGEPLGGVDVLGIRHDVVAPIDGVISQVMVEDDQAVEYGQVLAHIDAIDPVAEPPAGREAAAER